MTAFTVRTAAHLGVDRIMTSVTAYALYNNPLAMFEGDASATGAGIFLRAAALHTELGKLLSEQTVTASADIQFTGALDWTTYDWYTLQFRNVVPATNGRYLIGRVFIGGSKQTGANYRTVLKSRGSDGTDRNSASVAQTFMYLTDDVTGIASASADYSGASGEIHIIKPNHGSKHTQVRGWAGYPVNTGAPVIQCAEFSGYYASTSAVNGFSIEDNGGGNLAGNFKLYGRRYA